jgi:hypothetical protein
MTGNSGRHDPLTWQQLDLQLLLLRRFVLPCWLPLPRAVLLLLRVPPISAITRQQGNAGLFMGASTLARCFIDTLCAIMSRTRHRAHL